MTSGASGRPVIFLDVDGTLIPFSARPASRQPPSGIAAGKPGWYGNPLLDRLDPADGPRLLALGCDLAWATTWMEQANEVISPRLGLPGLPVVDWPGTDSQSPRGLHWKTTTLIRWAAGRPFIWLDDEITGTGRRWVAAHHAGRALPHRIDPHAGLAEPDFARIRQWLAE